jgi:methylated-DNA-[protein]-cysteine S-methyltransferase
MNNTIFNSPFGKIYISADSEHVHAISWTEPSSFTEKSSELNQQVHHQLDAYFSNPDFIFDLPLAPETSVFSGKMRQYLPSIPCGETRQYGEIAVDLSSSARAVGMACRHNPFALVVPCHRVVAKNALGGYYGQANEDLLDIKNKLLFFEKNRKV